MTTTTHQLDLAGIPLTVTDQGEGQPFLLLHGGGGPLTVAGFATLLAGSQATRVITPVHPGFNGTPRPADLTSVAELARLYAHLLDALDLHDVVVIGNSIGGWIAAELALLGSDRVARLVLVDSVGIVVDGHPVADIFRLTPAELSRLSYYDPETFGINPAAMTEEQRAGMLANRETLRVYGGEPPKDDPELVGRLAGLALPALVVWGEADQVCDAVYGRAYADAMPDARFVLLPKCGHLPQIEAPEELLRAVLAFAGAPASA